MSDIVENGTWQEIGPTDDFVVDLGVCVQNGDDQVAVFRLAEDEWYATQNLCPHQKQMVLSRGLTGDVKGEPKITCPLHKRSFSLRSGEFLGEGEMDCLKVYEVKSEAGKVFLKL
ncbi:nitrite reductase small subunit NirD [Puniceicoccaceae bacterium K14]|nr:nitrite reductase small subunit NirD [Puniceicoccaceae bacterium K14]